MLTRLLKMIDLDQSGEIEVTEFLRFAAPLEVGDGAEINVDELEGRIERMAHHVRDSDGSGEHMNGTRKQWGRAAKRSNGASSAAASSLKAKEAASPKRRASAKGMQKSISAFIAQV